MHKEQAVLVLAVIGVAAVFGFSSGALWAAASDPAAPSADVLFSCTFESDSWFKEWGLRAADPHTALVAEDADLKFEPFRGKALRIKVDRGGHYGVSIPFAFQKRVGFEPEEVYFRYYLRLADDWNPRRGGKFPGFGGTYGRAGWGGRRVNGRDGWSARGLFRGQKDGKTPIGFYCYHADMRGQYGSEWVWDRDNLGLLENNRWYCIEQYVKMNTPGKNDGILRGWVDGRLAFEKTDIRMRDVPALKIESVWVNIYLGGTWTAERDHHLYIDEVVISRKPIGPLAAASKADALTASRSPAQADMAFPKTAWEEAAPESQGVDSATLQQALDYLRENAGRDGIREVVVIRNGRLIWKGNNIDHQHGVWSCTKSFTSTVLGLLIDDGKATLDTAAMKYLPAMSKTFPGVTLRHFTTMTSGYYAVGDEPLGTYAHGPSPTWWLPADKPLFAPPGSRYAYWDSAMNQFGYVLTRIAGEPLEDLFKRRIADPIGMDRAKWDWGEFADIEGLKVNGGSGNSSRHMMISAREIARFGHLFLNRGNWNGRQLISTQWVDAATTVQVPATIPIGHPSSNGGPGQYGFNWWVNGIGPDGQRKWPEAPPHTFAAMGHNNNVVFVIPEWRMVVVRLGLDQKDRRIGDAAYSAFLGKVGAAIKD